MCLKLSFHENNSIILNTNRIQSSIHVETNIELASICLPMYFI